MTSDDVNDLYAEIYKLRVWLRGPGMPDMPRTAARQLVELVGDAPDRMSLALDYFAFGPLEEGLEEKVQTAADIALNLKAAEHDKREADAAADTSLPIPPQAE